MWLYCRVSKCMSLSFALLLHVQMMRRNLEFFESWRVLEHMQDSLAAALVTRSRPWLLTGVQTLTMRGSSNLTILIEKCPVTLGQSSTPSQNPGQTSTSVYTEHALGRDVSSEQRL